MFLYGNMESERASKGQGGNIFLSFDLKDCEGFSLWGCSFKKLGDNIIADIDGGFVVFERIAKQKRYAMRIATPEESKQYKILFEKVKGR